MFLLCLEYSEALPGYFGVDGVDVMERALVSSSSGKDSHRLLRAPERPFVLERGRCACPRRLSRRGSPARGRCPLCLVIGRGRTALMVAAAIGDMTTTLALLRMPRVDRRVTCADGLDAVDYAVKYGRWTSEGRHVEVLLWASLRWIGRGD